MFSINCFQLYDHKLLLIKLHAVNVCLPKAKYFFHTIYYIRFLNIYYKILYKRCAIHESVSSYNFSSRYPTIFCAHWRFPAAIIVTLKSITSNRSTVACSFYLGFFKILSLINDLIISCIFACIISV